VSKKQTVFNSVSYELHCATLKCLNYKVPPGAMCYTPFSVMDVITLYDA